jgi:hypothetical protein
MNKTPIIQIQLSNTQNKEKIKNSLIYSNIEFEMEENINETCHTKEKIENPIVGGDITYPYKTFAKIIDRMYITKESKESKETNETKESKIGVFDNNEKDETNEHDTKKNYGIFSKISDLYHLFDIGKIFTQKKEEDVDEPIYNTEKVDEKVEQEEKEKEEIPIIEEQKISEPTTTSTTTSTSTPNETCEIKIIFLANNENQTKLPKSGKTYPEIAVHNKLIELCDKYKDDTEMHEFLEKIKKETANFIVEDEDRESIKGTKEYSRLLWS